MSITTSLVSLIVGLCLLAILVGCLALGLRALINRAREDWNNDDDPYYPKD